MGYMKDLKTWYRWGYWFETPQGMCVLLSVPFCWFSALMAFLWPAETKPLFLSDGPVLFLFTPLLAFLFFVRFWQLSEKQFSSSVLMTLVLIAVIGMPFYVPYFRSHA